MKNSHKINLLIFSYRDFYKEICENLDIKDENILCQLAPNYRLENERLTRCERFAYWASKQICNYEDHWVRYSILRRYILCAVNNIKKREQRDAAVQLEFNF